MGHPKNFQSKINFPFWTFYFNLQFHFRFSKISHTKYGFHSQTVTHLSAFDSQTASSFDFHIPTILNSHLIANFRFDETFRFQFRSRFIKDNFSFWRWHLINVSPNQQLYQNTSMFDLINDFCHLFIVSKINLTLNLCSFFHKPIDISIKPI